MVAGEGSQLSLISLEGSCAAKTQQLPSSWLRLWEPARKAKMNFTPLQACAWSRSLSLSLIFFPARSYLTLFHTQTPSVALVFSLPLLAVLSFSFSFTHKKHSKMTPNCTEFSTFTPWLNYNLWFCSRPPSSICSVMWFPIPTLERTACGVGCLFRFLQINFVCLPSLL